MATRTVRLDEKSEAILAEIKAVTGLSVSDVLKHGLVAARNALPEQAAATPFDVYAQLDLGPGGYARAPARKAKTAIREILQQRRRP